MADDDLMWRRRFLALTLVRLAGLAILLLGVAIFYTDLLRPGGWPQAGAILIVLGAIDTVFAPLVLKKQWEKDRQ